MGLLLLLLLLLPQQQDNKNNINHNHNHNNNKPGAKRHHMVSGTLAPLYSFWVKVGLKRGSGPDRGRSPVEWGDFPSVCLSVRSSVRPFVHSSVCPFVRLSVCPFVHLSVCPFVRPFVPPS